MQLTVSLHWLSFDNNSCKWKVNTFFALDDMDIHLHIAIRGIHRPSLYNIKDT